MVRLCSLPSPALEGPLDTSSIPQLSPEPEILGCIRGLAAAAHGIYSPATDTRSGHSLLFSPVSPGLSPYASHTFAGEAANCLKEFYENDYAFYKKTMSSKPIRGLFNRVGKTAVKNIIKVMLSKAPAEELIETLNHQVALFLDYARQEIGTGPDDLLNRIKGFGDYFLTVFPKFVIPVLIKSILARSKIAKIAKGMPTKKKI